MLASSEYPVGEVLLDVVQDPCLQVWATHTRFRAKRVAGLPVLGPAQWVQGTYHPIDGGALEHLARRTMSSCALSASACATSSLSVGRKAFSWTTSFLAAY